MNLNFDLETPCYCPDTYQSIVHAHCTFCLRKSLRVLMAEQHEILVTWFANQGIWVNTVLPAYCKTVGTGEKCHNNQMSQYPMILHNNIVILDLL